MKSLFFFLCVAITSQAGAWTINFGNEGREGLQGQNGRSGRSGQNVLIQANQPGPQSFYLGGEDGTDAGPGQDGDSAYNCQQPPFVDNDLEGADGGDGGAGGSGGSGGDGGDATIYYTDLAQLKRILISSRGGQGGQGAWGGRGGVPCSCAVPSWVIPRCHEVATPDGKKRTVCEDYDRYTCVAGDRGRDGAPGRPGSEGSLGFVTLIKSKTPLLPEALSLQVSLRQFASKKSIDGILSENLFARQRGLLSLLAPGSQVSDSYSEFVRRAEEKVRLVWDSKKLATSYAGTISVSLNEGEVSFNVTSDEVLLTEERLENGVHTLYIRDAYNLSEFAILGLTLEGQKTGTLIRVKGASPRLDLVEDFVSVKISYKRVLLGYKEVFDGQVPVGALQRAGTDLLVNVGKMRFSSSDDIWNGKKEAKIELQIHRRIKGSDEAIARKAVFFTKKK